MIGALAIAALGHVGQCDPSAGPGLRWSAEVRAETRRRVRAVGRHVGASRAVQEYLDVVVVRESSGRPGVRHRLGEGRQGHGEDGLGAMGLSLRWHRDKWPGDDEDPMFCRPEVSALVTLAIMRRAVLRWGATDLVGVQAIFARGRGMEVPQTDGVLRRPPSFDGRGLCKRLRARGVSCHARIEEKDLGRHVRYRDRRRVAEELGEAFE